MKVYHNVVVYSREDAQTALTTLSQCDCCQRHQQNKPVVLQSWVELPTSERIYTNNICHCPCRHIARFICRDWGDELADDDMGSWRNDGLIYARDFVNVAQEPENGWTNWRWDPNTPIPELKVPIGSRYLLYTYDGEVHDDNYKSSIEIIELQSQEQNNPDGTPNISINFRIVGEHAGYSFYPEQWNTDYDGDKGRIGTHQEGLDAEIHGGDGGAVGPDDPIIYVIERTN
jgi:hypothetical protein